MKKIRCDTGSWEGSEKCSCVKAFARNLLFRLKQRGKCSRWINLCVLTHLHPVVTTWPVFCNSGSCPGREAVWPEKCTLAAELTDDVLSLELGGHGLLLITGVLSAAGTF